jgi:hypothetical protein
MHFEQATSAGLAGSITGSFPFSSSFEFEI